MNQLSRTELNILKPRLQAMITDVVSGERQADDLVRRMWSLWQVCGGMEGIWSAGLSFIWDRAMNALLVKGIDPRLQIQQCEEASNAQAGDLFRNDSVILDGLTWEVVELRHRLRTTDLFLRRGRETKTLSIEYRSPVRLVRRKSATAKQVPSYSGT